MIRVPCAENSGAPLLAGDSAAIEGSMRAQLADDARLLDHLLPAPAPSADQE